MIGSLAAGTEWWWWLALIVPVGIAGWLIGKLMEWLGGLGAFIFVSAGLALCFVSVVIDLARFDIQSAWTAGMIAAATRGCGVSWASTTGKGRRT